MGRPLPMEPYALPSDVETRPRAASVVASPAAKAAALVPPSTILTTGADDEARLPMARPSDCNLKAHNMSNKLTRGS